MAGLHRSIRKRQDISLHGIEAVGGRKVRIDSIWTLRRLLFPRLCDCAVFLDSFCLLGAPALAATLISASPSLFPAFAANVTDYVTRCEPEQTITVAVAAPA